jgi:hypothetical protein
MKKRWRAGSPGCRQRTLVFGGWTRRVYGKSSHPWYYLHRAENTLIRRSATILPKIREGHWLIQHPTLTYLSSIFTLTLLILLGVGIYTYSVGASLALILAACLLAFIPGISIAVNMLNWILTHTLKPRILPKMDFEQEVPLLSNHMVVPSLLTDPKEVELSSSLNSISRNQKPVLFCALADLPTRQNNIGRRRTPCWMTSRRINAECRIKVGRRDPMFCA